MKHHLKTKAAPPPQADTPDARDDWGVITATMDRGVTWRRYSDGMIVVTRGAEQPREKTGPRLRFLEPTKSSA